MTEKITKHNTPWPKWAAIAVGSDVNGLYDRALDAWESGADAHEWRKEQMPADLVSLDALEAFLNEIVPSCSYEYDNFGQLVIYTGMMLNDERKLIPLVFDEREEPDAKHDK